MASTLSDESISLVAQKLISNGSIDCNVDTAVLLYDLDFLQERIEELHKGFPATAVHAAAIKANPLSAILTLFKDLGCGFEVASLPELELARALHTQPGRVVFDSPAKTVQELQAAIAFGCHVNIDSFQELERVKKVLANTRKSPKATFGLRINPQVGMGKIEATSVAGEYSKFGIPFSEFRDEIAQAYAEMPWLTGVHLHIGSQGCSMDMLLRGCGVVYEFISQLNRSLHRNANGYQIRIFDIGGGLPVSYYRNQTAETFTSYARNLSRSFPALFSTEYVIVTEFGRHINANAAWVLSRVEYVKPSRHIHTVIIHVGADMFLRKCYRPDDWHHDMTVLDGGGRLKSGALQRYNIAGPLCFSGDFVAKDVLLPEIEEGDYIVIRDAGAYTISMWSRYNSRPMPRVVGYRSGGSDVSTIRHRENIDDIVSFWGPNEAI